MIDSSQIYYDRTQFGSLEEALEEALAFVSSLMPPEASRFRHPINILSCRCRGTHGKL